MRMKEETDYWGEEGKKGGEKSPPSDVIIGHFHRFTTPSSLQRVHGNGHISNHVSMNNFWSVSSVSRDILHRTSIALYARLISVSGQDLEILAKTRPLPRKRPKIMNSKIEKDHKEQRYEIDEK